MDSKKKPRQFSAEFKNEAVKMVLESKRKQTDVASSLGINANVLNRWVHEYKDNGKAAFPGQGKSTPEDQRIRDLEAQVKRITMERDILKKAIAYFAEVPK